MKEMRRKMTNDGWIFLTIWNGGLSLYWYYRYVKVVKLVADPEFLRRALEIIEEWEEDD